MVVCRFDAHRRAGDMWRNCHEDLHCREDHGRPGVSDEVCLRCAAFGHIALNPAELPEGMTPEEYMRICFAMLDVADEMWYLADAADSPGAFLEVQYCRYVKKRVRRFSEAVKEGKCETHPCD